MRNIFIIILTAFLVPVSIVAQESESRYNKEMVFPLRIRNISIGISPIVLDGFMYTRSAGSKASVTLPPIHLMVERCHWDLGNAGSIGSGIFVSYGRYTYTYAGPDGNGGNEIDVRVGTTNGLVGLSYHYTICTRLEAYARLMVGAEVEFSKSSKAGATADMTGEMIWNAVGGARYFFSNSWGAYIEGGYTSGAVNAGLTYRW